MVTLLNKRGRANKGVASHYNPLLVRLKAGEEGKVAHQSNSSRCSTVEKKPLPFEYMQAYLSMNKRFLRAFPTSYSMGLGVWDPGRSLLRLGFIGVQLYGVFINCTY